jgi:hypothetical protein
MALEGMEGHALVNTANTGWVPPWTNLDDDWHGKTGGVGAPTGTYYSGGASSAGYDATQNYLANKVTRVVGFRAYFNGLGSAAPMMNWCFGDGFLVNQVGASSALTQVGIGRNATGHFVAYRGRGPGATTGGTLLGTSASAPPLNTWVYMEIKVTVDPSAGVVQLKINGVDFLNLTGQNTRNTANTHQNSFSLTGSEGFWAWDDMYWLNTDGSAPDNDFLGECEVLELVPETGNGTHADSTPSTGSDRGANVREATPSAATYNAIATPGDEDTYNYPAPGSTGTIIGVQVASLLLKSDGGVCSARNITRISGTDYYGVEQPVSQTMGWRTDVSRVSPASGVAYTEAELAAAEFGVERVS